MKRALVLVSILALTLIALFEPTQIIRGIFQREAFFHNRPTRYWREVLRTDGKAGRLSNETSARLANNSLAIPILLGCFADSDKNVRWPAIVLLLSCGAQPEVIRALRSALDDTDRDIQNLAIRGLGRMGNDAFAATPQLIELHRDSDPVTASFADYSLWEIAPDIAAKSAPWHEFTSKPLGFSVAMPGRPEEKQSTVETPFGKGVMFQYTVMFGQTHFAMVVVEYPEEVTEEFTEEQRYDSAAEIKAILLGGELKRYDVIKKNGVSGRETVTLVPDKACMTERAYLIGNRAYMIVITNVPRLPVHPKEVEYYLDSLRITYAPGDKERPAAIIRPVAPSNALENNAGEPISR